MAAKIPKKNHHTTRFFLEMKKKHTHTHVVCNYIDISYGHGEIANRKPILE